MNIVVNRFYKNQIVLVLVVISIVISSCRKDMTDETDITKFKWELTSIVTKTETLKPKSDLEEYHSANAFILEFSNDSSFRLNTNVNTAGGKYTIIEKGKIDINSYGEFTEVGATGKDKELNDNLLYVFREVTTYKLFGDNLTFKGIKGEAKFKKK